MRRLRQVFIRQISSHTLFVTGSPPERRFMTSQFFPPMKPIWRICSLSAAIIFVWRNCDKNSLFKKILKALHSHSILCPMISPPPPSPQPKKGKKKHTILRAISSLTSWRGQGQSCQLAGSTLSRPGLALSDFWEGSQQNRRYCDLDHVLWLL